jgi:hypothetical protein
MTHEVAPAVFVIHEVAAVKVMRQTGVELLVDNSRSTSPVWRTNSDVRLATLSVRTPNYDATLEFNQLSWNEHPKTP